MKKLVGVARDIPWLPKPGEARLYLTDEMPPPETWGTAFGFAFDGDRILLTQLSKRGWDIPGGHLSPGETPQAGAVREVWEETCVRVEVAELIAVQELELFAGAEAHGWSRPLSTQIYFLCRAVEVAPFVATPEALARGFFPPEEARLMPTIEYHAPIYEEALRRVRAAMHL